ncbi:MFS transporter [Streptacidiphilus sp. P02-A3a]|uniref:MFS transporter n=1 Tax=Streptacidiphilus sp. P02-A3a TaxID=2704468 RepID=UPI0015F7A919|nr:MFS transporter [Streptacidiphilus sp. P02-A3a]QMU73102.1 MFS transporter [Streptacidiphilus sp. P02-A3a]
MAHGGVVRRLADVLPERGPQRALALASFVNRLGNGLFNTAAVLYFTLVAHLPATQVGLGLTVAGLIGLLAGFPAGNLADRRGPRGVALAALLLQAVSMAAFLFVHGWPVFTLIATVDRLASSAYNAARGTLVARTGGEHPARFRAKLRNLNNVAVVLGTLGAALAIQAGSRAAYTALIVANAASFLLCALFQLRLPDYPALPGPETHHHWTVLADRAFVAFAALDGAMGVQYQVVSLLLPIWISAHTHAPRWTVAAVYAVNSVVCVLVQTRIGTAVETPRQAGRAFRRAGLLFLGACPLMALSADVPVWVAPGLLVLAIAVHSVAEVWQSSAESALGFGLAPDHAQGQYQGLLGVGFDTGQALAPLLLTGVCLGLGQAGWLLLGAFLAALGLAGPPVARWAERTRQVVAVPLPPATPVPDAG